jgi:TrmH family RNA methyltransferase
MRLRRVRVRSEDNVFQHIEVLKRNRTKRHRFREFLVEGVKAIDRARAAGWTFTTLAYDADRRLSSWAQDTLAALPGATRAALSAPLMAKLSDKEAPSELLAVVAMPPDALDRIRPGSAALVVVFDRPTSPGNLGSIIRSCDALGADGLIVTGHGADVYDPQTVRASLGSLFALPVVWAPSHQEVAQWLDGWGGRVSAGGSGTVTTAGRPHIVGASGDGAAVLDAVDLTRPTVLVAGNETRGLSAGYRDLCDTLVRIPMSGAADSLNVACAASILLYEVDRQRRATRPGRVVERDSGLRPRRAAPPPHPDNRRTAPAGLALRRATQRRAGAATRLYCAVPLPAWSSSHRITPRRSRRATQCR